MASAVAGAALGRARIRDWARVGVRVRAEDNCRCCMRVDRGQLVSMARVLQQLAGHIHYRVQTQRVHRVTSTSVRMAPAVHAALVSTVAVAIRTPVQLGALVGAAPSAKSKRWLT